MAKPYLSPSTSPSHRDEGEQSGRSHRGEPGFHHWIRARCPLPVKRLKINVLFIEVCPMQKKPKPGAKVLVERKPRTLLMLTKVSKYQQLEEDIMPCMSLPILTCRVPSTPELGLPKQSHAKLSGREE